MSPEAPKQCSIVLSYVNISSAAIDACVVSYPWKELAPLSLELTTINLQKTLILAFRHEKGNGNIEKEGD